MDEFVKLTPEEARKRKMRSIAIGLLLAGLVFLFYVVTVVKFFPEAS